MFSAQRPGFGEKRPFQEPGCPAKPQVREARFSAALPSQDLVPAELSQVRTLRTIWGVLIPDRFSPPRPGRCAAAVLPSRDLVPPALSQARTLRTIEGNSCLWRPFFSQAGTMCRRNPPKQERCAATERSSASGTHLSPQNARSRCPEAALRGFFVRAGGGVSGSGAYW